MVPLEIRITRQQDECSVPSGKPERSRVSLASRSAACAFTHPDQEIHGLRAQIGVVICKRELQPNIAADCLQHPNHRYRCRQKQQSWICRFSGIAGSITYALCEIHPVHWATPAKEHTSTLSASLKHNVQIVGRSYRDYEKRSRACPQLSQMIAATRWIAARKFLAVLS
jgi:hypothetical protein